MAPNISAPAKDFVAPDTVAAALREKDVLGAPLGQGAWSGDVYVLPYTFGSPYDVDDGSGGLNIAPRQWVSQSFYQNNPDTYDFIVVFTNFDFDTREARAFYTSIKNDVQGIGQGIYDSSGFFGSQHLEGYLDGSNLAGYRKPDGSVDQAAITLTLNHEIGHRWLAHILYPDSSGNPTNMLLGRDNSHWSYLLDSNASYLYGSKWVGNQNGTYTAIQVEQRYSDLDLYLMGLVPKEQVSPFTLLVNPDVSREGLPVLGDMIQAQPSTISVDQIIAANGIRVPDDSDSPKEFRAAFIYLIDPATNATPEDLEVLNTIRSFWTQSFFQQTGGRAIVSPNRGVPQGSGAGAANLTAAVNWLANAQRPDGHWQDSDNTGVRETSEALAALALFGTIYDSQINQGATALETLQAASSELVARKAEAMILHGGNAQDLILELRTRGDGTSGWGAFPRYASDPVTTARVVRALYQSGDLDYAEAGWGWLTSAQNADGGWGWRWGGASAVYPTLEVLVAARTTRSAFLDLANVQAALNWLLPQQTGGGFGEPYPGIPETAMFLQVVGQTDAAPQAVQPALDFLASGQESDGSWGNSIYETALTTTAIARFSFPDPLVLSSEIYTDPEAPFEDGDVTLHVAVMNDGSSLPAGMPYRWELIEDGSGITRQSFDGALPYMEGHSFVPLSDTRTLAIPGGSYQLRFTIDPERTALDSDRSNNDASIPFIVKARAGGVDLAVLDFSSTPNVIHSVPQTLMIQGTILNHGRTDSSATSVVIYDGPASGGIILGTATVAVPAGGSTPVAIPITANQGKTYHLTVQVQAVDPPDEGDLSNNLTSLVVPISDQEDVEIISFDVTPSTVTAGEPVTLTATVRNSGTVLETGIQMGFTYVSGNPPASHSIQLMTLAQTIQPGETQQAQVQWIPVIAGDSIALTAVADPQEFLNDVNRDNNSANTFVTVAQSTLPNLFVSPATISVDPIQPMQGQNAHLNGVVQNLGSTASGSFNFLLRLDDPQSGRILGSTVVNSLGPGMSTSVDADWTVDQPQDRLIYVVADPENSVSEFNEQDNSAFSLIDVQTLPDLVMTSGQVEWTPAFPAQGESVQFTITVLNTGDQNADHAALELVDREGSVLASQDIASVPPRSSVPAQIGYLPASTGELNLVVRINHAHTIPELSFDNNEVSVVLPVQNGDIFVSEKFFSPNGDGIKDTTTVHFRDAVERVSVFNGDGDLIRTITSISGTSAVWDGKVEDGHVVPDGSYELRAGSLSTWVVVDDNLVSISSDPQAKLINGSIVVNGYLHDRFIGPQEGSVFYVEEHPDGSQHLFRYNGYQAREIGDWPSGYEDIIGCSADASICLVRPDNGESFSLIRFPGADVTPFSPPFQYPIASLSPDGMWVLWALGSDAIALQSVENPGLIYDLSCRSGTECVSYGASNIFWSDRSSKALVFGRSSHGDAPVADFLLIELDNPPRTSFHLAELPVPEKQSCYEGGIPMYASVDFDKGEAYFTTDTYYGRVNLLDGTAIGSQVFAQCDFSVRVSSSGAVIRWMEGLYDVRSGRNTQIPSANTGNIWSSRDKYLFGSGDTYGAVSSIGYTTVADNLMVALHPRVLFGNSGIELHITVADRNLDRFVLEYADVDSPDQFLPVGAPSREPIYDDSWGTWIPPHKGRFILRLTAWDLAGNLNTVSKSVTWNGDNDIANLYSETRYISPAASPGIKDNFVIHYVVLRPANLIFRILDGGDRLVRTLLVPAPQTGDATTVWDGKEEGGNFVADGQYSLDYLGARWPVTVDNTPPDISFSIAPNQLVAHWNPVFPVNLYRNVLRLTSEDSYLDRWTLSSKRFGTANEWGTVETNTYPIPVTTSPNGRTLSFPTDKPDGVGMSWVAGKEFRFETSDLAGNVSSINRIHREEQIAFADSEPPCRDDDTAPCIYPERPDLGWLMDYLGLLDFAIFIPDAKTHNAQVLRPYYNTLLVQESVWGFRPSDLRLEYRTHTPVGDWNQGVFGIARDEKVRYLALAFLAPPVRDNVWMGYWDHPDLPMRDYEVRLVARNQDGQEIDSPTELFAPQGLMLEYLDTDLDGVRVRVTNQTDHLLHNTIILAASSDTNFGSSFGSIPVLLPGESREMTSGCFLFSVSKGPNPMTFQAAASDTSGVPTYSDPVLYTLLGVYPFLTSDFVASQGCSNNPPPSGLKFLSGGYIVSPGGQATLVSQMLPEPTGTTPEAMEIRLNNQVLATAPYSAQGWPTFNLDFSSFAEAVHRLSITYRFPSGQNGLLNKCAAEIPLTINRTPPTASILSPANESFVCPQDLTGVCPQKDFVPVNMVWSGDIGILNVNGSNVWTSDDRCGTPFPIPAPEGFGASYAGEYELRPMSVNEAGWYGCGEPVRVNTASGIQMTASPDLFSPLNSQGRPVATTFAFTASMSGAYVVEIQNTEGTVVRTLSGTVTQGEVVATEWDGRDSEGSLTADGVYTAKMTINGACAATSSVKVEVDKTPPSVAVLRPAADEIIGATLEAHGLVLDKNFERYELQVRAAGACDTCWVTLDSQSDPREQANDVLGIWDTGTYPAADYEFQIWAIDRPGNLTSVLIPVTVRQRQLIRKFTRTPDLISPINADGQFDQSEIRYALYQNAIVTLEIRNSEDNVLYVYNAPGAYRPEDYVFSWDGHDQPGAAVPDGDYYVVLQVIEADNPTIEEDERLTIVVDNSPPDSDVTNIFESALYGLPLSVRGSVSDTHPHEYSINLFSPDGTERILNQGIVLTEQVIATLTAEVDGNYRLAIHATDRALNAGDFERNFTLDSTMPVAQIVSPLPAAVVNSQGPLTLEGFVSAPHIDHYEWAYATGVSPQDSDFVSILTSSAVPPDGHTVDSWDASLLTEGSVYTLRLRTVDQLQRIQTDSITIQIDNTPPVIEIQQPQSEDIISSSVAVQGIVSDRHLKDWKLDVLPNGSDDALSPELAGGIIPVSGQLALWSVLPPDGVYNLRLTATDQADNTAQVAVAVHVEFTRPSAPVNLIATMQNVRDANLTWQAGAGDLPAGYSIYRDSSRINSAPVLGTQYVDSGLSGGSHSYVVRALSAEGRESVDSNIATVNVELIGPLAEITSPSPGQRLSGTANILGTAYSELDFKEYRLSVRPVSGDWTILLRRTAPVLADNLGIWDTSVALDGPYELKLETEDMNGNIGTAAVSVVVDNTPPDTHPILVQAVKGAQDPDGETNDVFVQWTYDQPPPDFGGYFLYANGQLANAAGPVIGSQLPYLLQSTDYNDKDLPDGTYIYSVTASDLAGNESESSNNSAPVVIETRRPHAVIVTPEDGGTFTLSTPVAADAPDLDIVSMQFEYKKPADPGWTALGAPLAHPPFVTTFVPPSYGSFQVHAVASDAVGADPAPAFITVTHAPGVPELSARVDGGDVTLTWPPAPNPYNTLQGYNIYRSDFSGLHRINTDLVTDLTFVDQDLIDNTYEYQVASVDQGIESALSEPVPVTVYTPTFDWLSPIVDSEFVNIPVHYVQTPSTVDLQKKDASGIFNTVSSVFATNLPFVFEHQALSNDMQKFRIVGSDEAENRSKPSDELVLVRHAPPQPVEQLADSTSAGTVTLSWRAADPDSSGFRIARNGSVMNETETPFIYDSATHTLIASSGTGTDLVVDGDLSTGWKPDTYPAYWQWTWPNEVEISEVDLTWTSSPFPPERFEIDVQYNGQWLWLHSIQANTLFFRTLPVGIKSTGVRLRATDSFYWQDATLAELQLKIKQRTENLFYSDSGLAPGVYDYSIVQLNRLGQESIEKTIRAFVDIQEPLAPTLTVEPTGVCGYLLLSWQPPAVFPGDISGYVLYRSQTVDDPYSEIAHFDSATVTFADFVPTEAFYKIKAVGTIDGVSVETPESTPVSAAPVCNNPPEPPVITYPTVSGIPIILQSPSTDIEGTAALGAIVHLIQNGQDVAQTVSNDQAVASTLAGYERGEIALSGNGRVVAYPVTAAGGSFIAVRDLDTGEEVELGDTASYSTNPTVSADGEWIAYSSNKNSTDGTADIFVYERATGTESHLVAAGDQRSPSFSANGRWLAYVSGDGAESSVVVLDRTLHTSTVLYSQDQPNAPVFSPDGSTVLLATATGLIVIDRETLQTEVIPGDSTFVYSAAPFSPDGSAFLYSVVQGEPWTSTLWKFDLQEASSTQISEIQGETAGLFRTSDTIDFLAVTSSGDVTIRERNLATSSESNIMQGLQLSDLPMAGSSTRYALIPIPSGGLVVLQNQDLIPIREANVFHFQDVALTIGTNTFVARQDFSGTTLDSEPITVEFSGAVFPDAVSSLAAFPPYPLSGNLTLISGAVFNSGQTPLENCRVLLQRIAPGGLPVTVQEQRVSLAPGESTQIRYFWDTTGVNGDYRWVLSADPNAEITEGSESNNVAQAVVPVRTTLVVEVDATTDQPAYLPGQNVGIHIKVFTNKPPADYSVRTVVEDAHGYLVGEVENRALPRFGPGTVEYDLAWPIPDIYPGTYNVLVSVSQADGRTVSDRSSFELLPPMNIAAQVATSNSAYTVGDPVAIEGLVKNLGQATVLNLAATFRVLSAAGDLMAEEVRQIAAVPPSTAIPLSWTWQSAGASPGSYAIRLEVKNSFGIVVADANPVAITLTQPPVSIAGVVTASPSVFEPGQTLNVAATITNTGASPLQNVQIDLTILNPQNMQELSDFVAVTDLAPQQSFDLSHSFNTSGMPLGSYLLLLTASGDSGGPFEVHLAQTGLTVTDSTPPDVHLISPSPGLICDQAFLQVQATDTLSGVLEVSNSVDHGAQQLILVPLSIPDMYGATWSVPPDQEGSHEFEITAQDFYRNHSNVIDVAVTVDINPPGLEVQAPDGVCSNQPVQALFNAVDPHPDSVTATLNGAPYVSGATIAPDGAYTLIVSAADVCGHVSAATRSFVIDATAPSIAVAGVADGESYTSPVTPTWSIQDANLSSTDSLLNGQPVVSGATISETGSYTLQISAVDCAQNQTQVVFHFDIGQHAPVAIGEAVSVDEDSVLPITLHATDADGDPLSYSIVNVPAHGMLSGLAPNVTYMPAPDFHGQDSFTFIANDGHVDSGVASVNITVVSVNDAPVAESQSVATDEDSVLPVLLTAHDVDGDALTYSIVTPPVHGTLSGRPPRVLYSPTADFNGSDNFTFRVSDGAAESNTATVSIRVLPVDDPPIAVDDSYAANKDFTLIVRAPGVLANDTDVDGKQLTAILVSPPSRGFVTLNPDGSFRYAPNSSYIRSDSFTYKASDGFLYSGTAKVSIAIRETVRCPDAGTVDYGDFVASHCDGTVEVANQADLDAYEMDFSSKDSIVRNLDVNFNPSGNAQVISPCLIRFNGNSGVLSPDAGLLCVYGRGGVLIGEGSGAIRAKELTVVSERGSAGISNGMNVSAEQISIQAEAQAFVGDNALVTSTGSLSLISTGAGPESGLTIGQNAAINAPDVIIEGPRCTIPASAVILSTSRAGSCFGSWATDHAPPQTFVSCSVPLSTSGEVTEIPASALFTLSATDSESGVAATFYTIDDHSWAEYTEPFDFLNHGSGNHTVCFFSRDRAGNEEAAQCVTVRTTGQRQEEK